MTKALRIFLFLLVLCCLIPSIGLASPPPVIESEPLDQVVALGGSASFTVVATSATALSYQWYKDGLLFLDELLPGQTSSTATLKSVGSSDSGQYFVRISNAGGTVASRKASLTVVANSPPVAKDDSYSVPEDVALSITADGILSNDADVNGRNFTALLVTNVDQGILDLRADGSFDYKPPKDYSGNVSFTYCALDGITAVLEQDTSGGSKQEIRIDKRGSQSFRHGTAGGADYAIRKVVLYLSTEPTRPNAGLNFSIGTGINTGPIPGSSVLIPPLNITNLTGGNSFQQYELVFDPPVGPLSAGSTYYMNMECAANNDRRFWLRYDSNYNFSNGTYYSNGTDDRGDITFQILGSIVSNPATVTISITPRPEAPIFVSQRMSPNGFEAEVTGPAASTFVISASTNLVDWFPMITNYSASGRMSFTDSGAKYYPVLFYRAEVR